MAKQSDKLNRAIIVSIILHVVFIGLLVLGASIKPLEIGADAGGAIEAIMVDPGLLSQQYQRIEQQKNAAKRAQEQADQAAQRQAKELQDQQVAEQNKVKQIEKDRISAERAQKEAEKKTEQAALEKSKLDQQIAKATEAKKLAEVKAAAEKIANEQRMAAEKKASEQAAKEKAAADKVAKEMADKALAEAKAKADAAKNDDAINNLFDDLAADKNAPPAGNPGKSSNNNKNSGASNVLSESYQGQIKNAIENKFNDPQLYLGKTCTLRINLAPDGMMVSTEVVSGDPALCRVASIAAKQANIPKPPSQAVYKQVKNALIVFAPE